MQPHLRSRLFLEIKSSIDDTKMSVRIVAKRCQGDDNDHKIMFSTLKILKIKSENKFQIAELCIDANGNYCLEFFYRYDCSAFLSNSYLFYKMVR